MFNPLSPSEMITAIGRAAREAARGGAPLSDFERTQLKSAYSATRHLAIEIAAFPRERERFRTDLSSYALTAAGTLEDEDCDRATLAASAVSDEAHLAQTGCELLETCRRRDGEPWVTLAAQIRALLRDLCDREVQLLAAGIEVGR